MAIDQILITKGKRLYKLVLFSEHGVQETSNGDAKDVLNRIAKEIGGMKSVEGLDRP